MSSGNYRGTVRPTNRAVSQEGQGPPEGDRVNGSLHNIRDEIASLRSQISRGIETLGSTRPGQDSSARDMEELADYFSQRLAKCQKQVYNVVNHVHSEVDQGGHQQDPYNPNARYASGKGGKNWDENGDFDSSDSGIGQPKPGARGTIRPAGRAAHRGGPPSSIGGGGSLNPYGVNQVKADPYGGARQRIPSHQGSMRKDPNYGMQSQAPPQQHHQFVPGQPTVGADGIPRCSQADDVEDFSHFENYFDDDMPAPEASIPVPRVHKKHQNYIYQALYAMYVIALLAYIYVRIAFTLDAPGLNRIYCTVVACLEIITCPSLLIQGLTLWRWISRPEPSLTAFERPKFHTIRIMVPTYKEPLEVVAGTVHEVVHMDVCPGLNIHVYVLDDGRRQHLEEYILARRTKKYVYLHYVARPKLPGIPNHAKAGNINHTLHYVYDNGRTEGEAVVIFDADFMPRRNYLWRVLPVFSEKRARPIGLVQTPQFFYNVNSDEDVWDHLNVSFFHRIEPSLDQWSAVNCCGTNFTVRADALKDVGYFPVGCLTEDTLLSLRLCTMGWAVSYHHEVLAIGQSPHEIIEVFKQRSRWCKGNLQIFLDEFPLMQSGLTMSQRIFYSSCGYNYFCASISIPFFQLVPSWAIFFGLWPVSSISLQFAVAFFVYYCLGNMLLLFPPPGFAVKDMWNGELASTNLWYTYFNGVRRIVSTKITQGKGELTFKTTKKKAEGEEEEGSQIGFQKEDLRVCYMHFVMFFLMLITIVYAIVQAVTAVEVKFYFYYMYMIGMSWSLINMVPYLIVVIYCYFRVRIPGLICACLRNIQLLLRAVCGVLILVQAYTTRNLTERFICPHDYIAEIGRSPLTMVRTMDEIQNLDVERNAFWLLGVDDDFYTIQQIKQSACEEDSVPIVVFFMHPRDGLQLDEEAAHYMPENRLENWEEYDEKVAEYSENLQEVPIVLILEPALLMHTFNERTEYHNTEFQVAFATRVQKIIESFPRAWVYVDAGNALYLQWATNMNHIVDVLKQMPLGLRGFSINVGSFVNSTYNLQLATEIHCQTGLNFILDTSRNGGMFSERTLDEINECTYDPPFVSKGSEPGWAGGSKNAVNQKSTGTMDFGSITNDFGAEAYDSYSSSYDEYAYRKRRETGTRQKRWSMGDYGGGSYDAYGDYDGGDAGSDYGDYYADYGAYDTGVIQCLTGDPSGGHDANAWVKTPGEADGRLYSSGTFHECLLQHSIECSDQCPQYVPKINGEFERPSGCTCD